MNSHKSYWYHKKKLQEQFNTRICKYKMLVTSDELFTQLNKVC